MSDIHKSLVKIQSELKAAKNQYNNFGKYPYRSCEDIVEAVKPLLHAEGLVLLMTDEIINIGNHNYIEAMASIRDGENDITVKAVAREAENRKGMDDSQITGATSSYARKYALNGLFAIDDTKDADTMKPEKEEKKVTKEVKKGKEMTIELLISNLPSCKTTESLEKYMADNKKFVNSLFDKDKKEVIAEFSKRKTEIVELGGNSNAQR